jgi:iron complex transport system substrate-binding protein
MEGFMKPNRGLFFVLIIAALLAGCSTSTTPTVIPSDPSPEPVMEVQTEAPSTETPAPELFTVVDALGREVTFDAPPQRIAIAGRATSLIAHSVYMFPEAIERIVAVEDRVQRDLSFYSLVDSMFEKKLLLERNAGPEQIIPANPDTVFMKSYLAESLGEPIEQLDIPVVYFDLETPEAFLREIRVIGTLLGNPERAEEILQFYTSRTEQVDGLIAPIPESQYPSVLLMQYSDRGGEVAFNVPSADWLQTSLITEAGGSPVWLDAAEAGGWTIVGFEQIAAWDPQLVIVIYYSADPSSIVDTLKADANWQALQATQNGEIYGFPGDFLSWDQPDPRWILGLEWLVTILHPEQAKAISLEAEITAFYEQLYNLDPATIEEQVFSRFSPASE